MKKLFILGLFFAATAFVTLANVQHNGPFTTSSAVFDSTAGKQPGGRAEIYLAAAANTLLVGDVVYMSSKNNVAKSVTLANYNALLGVVIGGSSTNMQAGMDSVTVGTRAALPGGRVLVLRQGKTWVMVDSTTATGIAPGIQVIPDNGSGSIAGRVLGRTTAIDSFGRIIGKAVDTGISKQKVLISVNVK